MNLVLKLIAGIAAGLMIGAFAPDVIARIMLTVQTMVGQLISFTIPLIILLYIANGIGGLPRNSGKMLAHTVALAYGSTVIAGTLAFIFASSVLPSLVSAHSIAESAAEAGLTSYINLKLVPVMEIMTALVLAFVLGIGMSAIQSKYLNYVIDEGRQIIDKLLAHIIIPLLPFYIAGVFTQMTLEGSAVATLKTFGVVLMLAVAMHWFWLTCLYVLTGLVQKKSPLTLLKNMLPAYFTALGTMSSAATIPVSLNSSKNNGVDSSIANFTVPLCATIHLSGSVITIVTCTTAVMLMTPELVTPSLGNIIPFILMLGITLVAAPGAPGGAIMAALGILASMLGFGEGAVALMIALYLAQDSFGTACNVTGDGVIALWVDHWHGNGQTEAVNSPNAA
ncbi:dicarboxylate/amino acid:cation symporter [Echinimonas agarilytica]|uniref:Dicarboxylate/amino acid:cation symporter n=1 Tax=Echinimonas agarilytica TaxID=1215918 RepID=A0AA41W4P4_9GAMM|nr:dicarboxylate/amino acid:cation symporter [Echinimonas agarilytica]MCM2678897.1 dicarboxylate/amino acid:cation symporter [Echinimonas agarilytica]